MIFPFLCTIILLVTPPPAEHLGQRHREPDCLPPPTTVATKCPHGSAPHARHQNERKSQNGALGLSGALGQIGSLQRLVVSSEKAIARPSDNTSFSGALLPPLQIKQPSAQGGSQSAKDSLSWNTSGDGELTTSQASLIHLSLF